MSFKEIIKNVFGNKGDNKMKEVVELIPIKGTMSRSVQPLSPT